MTRNSFRMGDPNSAESIAWTVDRYGPIKPETLSEIVAWLEKHTDEYEFKVGWENLRGEVVDISNEGFELREAHPIIKTHRKGSSLEKTLDNERDAQNTLANIRNPEFPKNKQGQ